MVVTRLWYRRSESWYVESVRPQAKESAKRARDLGSV